MLDHNICCLHGALEIGASQSKQKTRTLTLTEVWHSYYDPMRAQDSDRPDQSEAIWQVMTMGHISRAHICHIAMLCPSDGQLWAHCPGIFKFKITKWTILAVLASGVYWVRVAWWASDDNNNNLSPGMHSTPRPSPPCLSLVSQKKWGFPIGHLRIVHNLIIGFTFMCTAENLQQIWSKFCKNKNMTLPFC